MTIVIQNRQRSRRIDTTVLKQIAKHLLGTLLLQPDAELGIHLVNAVEMAKVNETYLGHTGSTDVITFDHNPPGTSSKSKAPPLHGELFICVDDAIEFAREFATSWQAEVVRYVVHGVLHLRGFDDLVPDKRRVMKREENRLTQALESHFRLRTLAKPIAHKRA